MRFFSLMRSGILLPLAVLGALACAPQKPSPVASTPSATPLESALAEPTPFAGSAACQECHASEFASHAKSFHASTLREATVADLGPLAPSPGPVPGEGEFTIDDGRLVAHSSNSTLPLQLALGSGKTGITFLAILAHTSAEIRQSYFPRQKRWYLTPGIEDRSEGVGSMIHDEDETRVCLDCHAVTQPVLALLPEKRFFGVGCESCHGAGGEHVTAMKALKKGESPGALAIQSLRGAGGAKLNTLCGRCHRTSEDVASMSSSVKRMTNRFQPYGLAQSRCFKESGDKLTCVTCHNPHENAGTDPKPYETACLSCHTSGHKDTQNHPQKSCPVNPRDGCVSCHMPTRSVFIRSKIPIQMADHFIRINKNAK